MTPTDDGADRQQLRREAESTGGGLAEDAVKRARGELAENLEPDEPVSSLEDMRVSRNGDGDLEPKKVRTLWERNVIRFRPMTYRDRNKYRLDQRGLIALSDEERVEFLAEHVVEPEGFAEMESPEDLEDFGWTTIDDLLLTIQLFSRDRRRDQIPRPVRDGGGKEVAEA